MATIEAWFENKGHMTYYDYSYEEAFRLAKKEAIKRKCYAFSLESSRKGYEYFVRAYPNGKNWRRI